MAHWTSRLSPDEKAAKGREGGEGQELNKNRGTNNKMQWKTKLVKRWYAQSYRAGDHSRLQDSSVNRL